MVVHADMVGRPSKCLECRAGRGELTASGSTEHAQGEVCRWAGGPAFDSCGFSFVVIHDDAPYLASSDAAQDAGDVREVELLGVRGGGGHAVQRVRARQGDGVDLGEVDERRPGERPVLQVTRYRQAPHMWLRRR